MQGGEAPELAVGDGRGPGDGRARVALGEASAELGVPQLVVDRAGGEREHLGERAGPQQVAGHEGEGEGGALLGRGALGPHLRDEGARRGRERGELGARRGQVDADVEAHTISGKQQQAKGSI